MQKVSAVTGVAAVGATALGFAVVPGQDKGGTDTAGSALPAEPVAWQSAVDSSADQKSSIDAQTAHAQDAAQEEAKAKARQKAEAEQRAAAAKAAEKARAEAARKKAAEEAEQRAAAREKAAQEREQEAAASRSAERKSVVPSGSPQEMARQIIGDEAQFQCFSNIVERESGWDPHAENPSSGAYGLVQALPGSKMASEGADWKTNPATQIKWGLGYMNDRYGSPCGAWDFWQANNWY
nr:transglycosylase SLT domain-containing protein [Streptomyces sp. HNM0574]